MLSIFFITTIVSIIMVRRVLIGQKGNLPLCWSLISVIVVSGTESFMWILKVKMCFDHSPLCFFFLYVNTIIIFHLGTPQNILWITVIGGTWSPAFGCGEKAGYQNKMGKNAPDRELNLKTILWKQQCKYRDEKFFYEFQSEKYGWS